MYIHYILWYIEKNNIKFIQYTMLASNNNSLCIYDRYMSFILHCVLCYTPTAETKEIRQQIQSQSVSLLDATSGRHIHTHIQYISWYSIYTCIYTSITYIEITIPVLSLCILCVCLYLDFIVPSVMYSYHKVEGNTGTNQTYLQHWHTLDTGTLYTDVHLFTLCLSIQYICPCPCVCVCVVFV